MIGLARDTQGVTPKQAVARFGPATLHRFASRERRHLLPVVLVPSIINRARVFDLGPGQSVAAHLLAAGLDVYLLDWGEPRAADAHLGVRDYALRFLRRALAAARARSGAPAAHLFGYCLGGTFALIAATRLRDVASVCALTTPVDLGEPGAMGVLTDARLVDLERLAAGWPIVPGPALWAAFQALDPVGIERKLRGFLGRAGDAAFRARFAAQEGWLADPVAMTARSLDDVVGRLYRDNALARNAWSLEGAPVRLAEGRAPVLNLIAARDTIVPPPASRALADLWGGPVVTRDFPGGHIGVCVGSRAASGMWAAAADWLSNHQERSA